jgi:quercetin dioxygenase-like cupin family protein
MKKIAIFLSVSIVAAGLVLATGESKSNEISNSTSTSQHHIFNAADLKWGDAAPGLPPGAKMALLNGNPNEAGPFTVRMRAPAGYTIPPHTHPTAERLTVISGSFRIGMGGKLDESGMQELGPGGYVVLPSGMAHFARSTTDSILQIDSEGPFQINYVNASDDPRNAKK